MARTVSVVIPTKDSRTLIQCLDSIRVGRAVPTEVLVVDSSRDSLEIPERLSECLHVGLTRERLSQLAAKRQGAMSSRGDLVLYLDSDQQIGPCVLSQLMETTRPMIVIPEVVLGSGTLTGLMNAHRRFLLDRFRVTPDPRVPVIPRAFERTCLIRGFNELERRYPSLEGLPHLHEDSILFRETLQANQLLPDAIEFIEDVLLHAPVEWRAALSKAYSYGYDRGSIAAGAVSHRVSSISPEGNLLKSLDFWRWRPYVGRGLNIAGLIYDGVRAGPMFAGYLRGRAT